MNFKSISFLAPLLSAGLAGGMLVEAMMRPGPRDSQAYLARVRQAAEAMPMHLGDWVGQDVPVPPSAIALLRPNVISSRRYRNVTSGAVADLLLVHCTDARDLAGHYPPICYPAHGHTLLGSTAWDRDCDGWSVAGTEYEFTRQAFARSSHTIVYNAMIMPDGTIARDMRAVREAAADYLRHFWGAGQVQILLSADYSREQRNEALGAMMQVCSGAIQAMRSGERQ